MFFCSGDGNETSLPDIELIQPSAIPNRETTGGYTGGTGTEQPGETQDGPEQPGIGGNIDLAESEDDNNKQQPKQEISMDGDEKEDELYGITTPSEPIKPGLISQKSDLNINLNNTDNGPRDSRLVSIEDENGKKKKIEITPNGIKAPVPKKEEVKDDLQDEEDDKEDEDMYRNF